MAVRETAEVQIILSNGKAAGTTINELTGSSVKLARELKSLTPNSQEFVKKSKDFDLVKKRLDEVKGQAFGVRQGLDSMKGTLSGIKTAFIGAFTIGAAISAVKNIVEVNRDFEKSLSTLKSITGATTEDLKFYSAAAKEIGSTTTLSAKQAVEAFTLIGSAKPDLLANKQALADVTREAVALSEAAGIELPAAAQALTGVLNQFQLSANKSSEVINVLAAGAKAGAAGIEESAASIDKFGTVAAAANITVQESVGLVQTLAEYNIKGAEAGTQLRNVILKLQAANLGYQSGMFNLNDALKEVEGMNLSAAESAKLFGLESVTAANILVNNVPKLEQYTTAVTGTNEAYEQQKINTDNLDGSIKGFNSAVEALTLSFNGNGGLTKALRFVIDLTSDFIRGLSVANQSLEDIQKAVRSKTLTAAMAENQKEVQVLADKLLATGMSQSQAYARAAELLIKQLSGLKGSWDPDIDEAAIDEQIADLQKFAAIQVKAIEDKKAAEDEANAKKIADAKATSRTIHEIDTLEKTGQIANLENLTQKEEELNANNLALFKEHNAARLESDEETAKAREQLLANANQSLIDAQKEYSAQLLHIGGDYLNTIIGFLDIERETRDANIKAITENEKLSGAEKAILIKKEEDAKRKSFERVKAFQIAAVQVDLIGEIQAIWRNASSNPLNAFIPGAGAVIAGFQTGAAIGRAALATTKISKQKFAGGGVLKGPRHSSGGIKTPYGEFEGDEIVLTGNVGRSSIGRKMASDINYAFGGRKFETGGPLNPLSSATLTSMANSSGTNGGSTPNASNTMSTQIVEELRMLRADVNKHQMQITQWASTLKVVNNVQDTQRAINVINEIQDSVNI
jgi:TP901 family phage tail tape measure protein